MILDFRKIENLHILLWLIKDVFWVLDFKFLGTLMIVPTLAVALWLTYRMRKNYSEIIHNLAVICWILANTTWMLGEFYWNDGTRPYATFFFLLGLGILSVYYLPMLYRTLFSKNQQ